MHISIQKKKSGNILNVHQYKGIYKLLYSHLKDQDVGVKESEPSSTYPYGRISVAISSKKNKLQNTFWMIQFTQLESTQSSSKL